MKIDRLISIIMILLEHDKMSASKLAKMFEVTPRTIYRDIETIALAGIPIVAYPGINGGISILENYKIDKKFFSRSDISTLLMGLGTVSTTLSSKDIAGTMAKIQSLVPDKQSEEIKLKAAQISIDLTPWAGNKDLQKKLDKIKKALDESFYLSFVYTDKNRLGSKRKIEPYQLVLKEGKWYLQGYCTDRQDFRVFKLLRITVLEVLKSQFTPREFHGKPLSGAGWIEKRLMTIKILIDESLLERIIERCGEENISAHGNNKYIVDFPFEESDYGYNLLLGFGDKCECLGPQNVRKELMKRIERMLNIYQ